MALVGPFTKGETQHDSRGRRKRSFTSTWYRTLPRFSQPCPYTKVWCSSSSTRGDDDCFNTYAYSALFNPPWWMNADRASVSNRLYERLLQSVRTSANLSVDLAERQQTINMIGSRLGQIRTAWNALRKGRLSDFKKALGVSRGGSRRSRPKQAANIWLEYHFGWSPLIQDIHDGCKILSQPTFFGKRIRAAARESFERLDGAVQYMHTVQMQSIGYASIDNLNLYTAQSLGLVNPATVAWELVPFSFVVDWFIPVGNFLNSFSDFVGLRIEAQQTATKLTIVSSRTIDFGSGLVLTYQGVAGRFERVLSWPSYQLTIPSRVRAFSLTRTLTALSLFVQQFGK